MTSVDTQSDRATVEASPGEPPSVSVFFMTTYFAAQFCAWMAIFTPVVITVALKVNDVASGAAKNEGLGQILAIGAFFALLAQPMWGAISDRTRIRFGRRRVWIAAGSLMLLSGLLTIATATTLLQIGIGWVICQVGSNATQASLYGVLADVVPRHQRGRMSGLLGLCVPLAMLSGTFLTQFTSGNHLAMFLVPWLPSALVLPIFLSILPDRPATQQPPFALRRFLAGFWVNPLHFPDFGWAFLSRFLVTFAAAFVLTYQVFFFIDRLHLPAAEVAGYVFLSKLIIGGLTVVFNPLTGWISDKVARIKPFVILPALFLSAGLFVASIADSIPIFMAGIVLVGIGQAVFGAVDLALCVAVLPDRDNSARYMGILGIATSLPQSIAPAIAPLLLAIGSGQNYEAMFLFGAAIGLLGALTVAPIRSVR